MRLFHKLLIVLLLATLLPLAFVGWRLVEQTETSFRATGRAVHLALARESAERFGRRLEQLKAYLTPLQKNPAFLEQKQRNRLEALQKVLENEPSVKSLWMCDAVGQPLGAAGKTEAVPFQNWAEVRALLLDRGEFWLPDPLGFVLVLPVESRPGWLVGCVAARVNREELGRTLSGIRGRFRVVTPDGQTVAHFPAEEAAGPALRAEALRGEWPGEERLARDGKPSLVMRAGVPGTDWLLFFERPTASVYEELTRARQRLFKSLLAAGLLAAFFSFFFSRYLTRPLNELRGVVKKMRAGDFGGIISSRSGDELGQLAEELRQAQGSLEKKTREAVLGKMARLIGHDLKIPLQSIRHCLEGLAAHAHALSERGKKYLELIGSAAEDADDFVEEILAVGRDRELVRRPHSLGALAASAAETLKTKPGVALSLALDETLPKVNVDEKAARRALANVIKNAHEAVGAEGGRVEIKSGHGDGSAWLSVKDNGPGISEEKRRRMFEEFTTKADGSGLGMLVVKKVMDQHGGRVEIESSPAGGTTVTLFFPAAHA